MADPQRMDSRLRELQQALAARDIFIATAGHELRNPMSPIAVLSTLLLTRARREPSAAAATLLPELEALERAVDIYIRRATVLLDVSRINAGQLKLAPAEVDATAVLADAAERYAMLAAAAGSTLTTQLQPDVRCSADQVALEQVIDNLLSNAVRYGAGQPIRLGLMADQGRAVITVEDGGIGIEPDVAARIFEPFERAVSSRNAGGFGIGLWVVRQLVEAMRGTIAVDSDPGLGAVFRIDLPLHSRSPENR